jgi:hypothetical protein
MRVVTGPMLDRVCRSVTPASASASGTASSAHQERISAYIRNGPFRHIGNAASSALGERIDGTSGTNASAHQEQNHGTSGTHRNHDSPILRERLGEPKVRNSLTQRINVLTRRVCGSPCPPDISATEPKLIAIGIVIIRLVPTPLQPEQAPQAGNHASG